MTTRFKSALNRFHAYEKPTLRGRRFVKVNLLIERLMRARAVLQTQIVDWFGPPDLFHQDERSAAYVYRFDHVKPSKRRDEWYFYFHDGILVQSGFNRAGINHFPHFQLGSLFCSQSIKQEPC
jgi:hypothetical protein